MADDPEQRLYEMADEAGLSIVRWDEEPLADFAHRLEEELAHKISNLQGMIDEVRDSNFDNAAEAAR
jgi:hypothetical protein